MAEEVKYISDQDGEEVALNELVTMEVTRGNEVVTIHISESQLEELMEESETLGALILRD